MKRKDLAIIVSAAALAAVVALFVSSMLFNTLSKGSKVPLIDKIESSFPAVNSEAPYNTFFNKNALDPTQPIQIGNTQNTSPFSP